MRFLRHGKPQDSAASQLSFIATAVMDAFNSWTVKSLFLAADVLNLAVQVAVGSAGQQQFIDASAVFIRHVVL